MTDDVRYVFLFSLDSLSSLFVKAWVRLSITVDRRNAVAALSHLRLQQVMRIQRYWSVHVNLSFLLYVLLQIVHGLHAVLLPAHFARFKVRLDGILESLRGNEIFLINSNGNRGTLYRCTTTVTCEIWKITLYISIVRNIPHNYRFCYHWQFIQENSYDREISSYYKIVYIKSLIYAGK